MVNFGGGELSFNKVIDSAITHYGSKEQKPETRLLALKHLKSIGIPGRKDEAWKYTSLKNFFNSDYCFYLESEAKLNIRPPEVKGKIAIYIKNGFIDKDQQQNLEKNFGIIVSEEDNNEAKDFTKTDFSELLNFALNLKNYSIEFPKGFDSSNLVELNYVTEDAGFDFCSPRISIYANQNLKIIEKLFVNNGKHHVLNPSIKLFLSKNTNVEYLVFNETNKQSLLIRNFYIESASQSKLNFVDISSNTKLYRMKLEAKTNGPGAEINLYGLNLLIDKEHSDHQTLIHHQFEKGISRQLYKGVLKNHSKSIFAGNIIIDSTAQEVSSEQLNKNLMLDENSEVDTKPSLEVYADNVQATHGATVGQIGSEEIFYLMSRGYSLEKARSALAHAYVADIVLKITSNDLKEIAHKYVVNKFKKIEDQFIT